MNGHLRNEGLTIRLRSLSLIQVTYCKIDKPTFLLYAAYAVRDTVLRSLEVLLSLFFFS